MVLRMHEVDTSSCPGYVMEKPSRKASNLPSLPDLFVGFHQSVSFPTNMGDVRKRAEPGLVCSDRQVLRGRRGKNLQAATCSTLRCSEPLRGRANVRHVMSACSATAQKVRHGAHTLYARCTGLCFTGCFEHLASLFAFVHSTLGF